MNISPQNPPYALCATQFETPLGTILAIASERALFMLKFVGKARSAETVIQQFAHKISEPIAWSEIAPIASIKREIACYCAGALKEFKTQFAPIGTPFQKEVWEALRTIPYGETRSYKEIATMLGKPTAYRAVAQANSANPIAIIIPCHRVIHSDGKLGGYTGGIEYKKLLLACERECAHSATKLNR